MATFFICTQVLENYGAHAKDGRFSSGNAYWKFKGGDEYIISGLDRVQDAVAFVTAIACTNDISWKEYVCNYREVAPDFLTEYEQFALEHEGEIRFPAKRINVQEYFATHGEAA